MHHCIGRLNVPTEPVACCEVGPCEAYAGPLSWVCSQAYWHCDLLLPPPLSLGPFSGMVQFSLSGYVHSLAMVCLRFGPLAVLVGRVACRVFGKISVDDAQPDSLIGWVLINQTRESGMLRHFPICYLTWTRRAYRLQPHFIVPYHKCKDEVHGVLMFS